MVDRLRDDHENAKLLARGLSEINGISLNLDRVQTNIVLYDISALRMSESEWVTRMAQLGVKVGAQEAGRIRMVTHRGIEKEDIEYTLEAAKKVARR